MAHHERVARVREEQVEARVGLAREVRTRPSHRGARVRLRERLVHEQPPAARAPVAAVSRRFVIAARKPPRVTPSQVPPASRSRGASTAPRAPRHVGGSNARSKRSSRFARSTIGASARVRWWSSRKHTARSLRTAAGL